ncbi:MAG: bacillithiol biosynthesis cysteine-adding enzyme BshC [Blastocatellia bacterium]
MTHSTIRFSEIPKTSKLFSDFLYDFGRVEAFYGRDGHDGQALAARAARVTAQPFDRDVVADVLEEQNRHAGAGPETMANIARLRQPDSVVVITGQQAGLFTGPLYTIFKALTVIRLAAQWREQGINVIPMFWIAAEDHDFAEVNHTRLVNRDGQLTTITYGACPPTEGKPVGHVILCEEINEQIDQLLAALPESEFTPRLAADLRDAYQPGLSFADAFGRLMMKLLGHFGVVLINPLDDRLKHVSRNIYVNALASAPQFADNLVRASAALETAGYHSQVYVTPESVPLFMLDEGRRKAMTRRDDGRYYLKGSTKSFPAGEMLDTVSRCPNCFSPNVTLRPVVQDFLLPTLAYIGGPAEIAYFAQLIPNYRLLGRVEPLVMPRASLTLVERRHAKTLAKQGLQFNDLFVGTQEVLIRLAEKSLDRETAAMFEETEKLFEAQLEKLRASLSRVDPPLADALKGGRENILSSVQRLRQKFIHNQSTRDETTRTQIERACAILYPNKGLQEREINITYFLARYGYGMLDRLAADLRIDTHDHQLIVV